LRLSLRPELSSWPYVGVRVKCKRCGQEFENPNPTICNPIGNPEIATSEWCAGCNKLTMTVVFRDASAYYEKGPLFDPLRRKE